MDITVRYLNVGLFPEFTFVRERGLALLIQP
jgi:hypothetical protein